MKETIKTEFQDKFFIEFKKLLQKYLKIESDMELLCDDATLILSVSVPTSTGGIFIATEVPELASITSPSELVGVQNSLIHLLDELARDNHYLDIIKLNVASNIIMDASASISAYLELVTSRNRSEENEIKNLLNGNEDNIH